MPPTSLFPLHSQHLFPIPMAGSLGASIQQLHICAEKVNQVWQVGPGVTDDHPMKHGFTKDNLSSFGELKLMNKMSSGASLLAPTPQVANNDKGDWWRVKEINVALWILALLSVMCF
ncbi:hypothetical protein PVK06_038691 [Gossypium arboreum]|uniref:AIR12 DOMON domain-containing protein n=1 Tax=Gossypium arboreum TaxID=29729 RepID=A0ABR0N0V4_GOSAR|nr:hypothetical protein PVK06_038691 [Gossypium arboreum]